MRMVNAAEVEAALEDLAAAELVLERVGA